MEPSKHFPSTNSPQWQTHIRTNWQKCPNSTSYSQKVLNGRQTSGPISEMTPNHFVLKREVCPGAHQWIQVDLVLELVPPRESISWQPVLRRWETGRISETNGFDSCQESPPESPSQDQLATSSWLIAAILGHCCGRGCTVENPGEPDATRVQSHVVGQKTYRKWGSGCSPLKSQ